MQWLMATAGSPINTKAILYVLSKIILRRSCLIQGLRQPIITAALPIMARAIMTAPLKDFNQAIMLNPGYAMAYYNRGLAYKAKGDDGRAGADFRKACDRGLSIACKHLMHPSNQGETLVSHKKRRLVHYRPVYFIRHQRHRLRNNLGQVFRPGFRKHYFRIEYRIVRFHDRPCFGKLAAREI